MDKSDLVLHNFLNYFADIYHSYFGKLHTQIMSGIYIHIPFCKQACHYCDFHFSTSQKNKNDFLDALKKEIFLQQNYFTSSFLPSPLGEGSGVRHLDSIYFGGGTPSLLSSEEIESIITEIKKYFSVDDNAEITLEANPDDLSEKDLEQLKQTSVNRLSIGVQSFAEDDLKFFNRAHHAQQSVESVKATVALGFDNITIDLIYGSPTLSNEQWKKNLEIAFGLPVDHLSCYCLTIEPRTALAKFIQTGKAKPPDEEIASQQFEILMNMAADHGFEQYEISNFARNEKYSRHNSSYWRGEKYLGLGPSAHSYDGNSRQWNVSNNAVYISSLNKNVVPFEKEELDAKKKFNEYVMVSLRTIWGCNLEKIKNDFGEQQAEVFLKTISKFVEQGFVENQKQNFILTRKGKFFADKIAGELFQ